jgi:hypothetical protein
MVGPHECGERRTKLVLALPGGRKLRHQVGRGLHLRGGRLCVTG